MKSIANHPNARTINVITLGCSKNVVDSENIMGALRRGGFQVVHNASGEGFAGVVINTCGFILDAKEESVDTIVEYAAARKEGRIGKLVVMGCLAQRYREELQEEIPEVDAVLGVNDQQAVAALFLNSSDTIHWQHRVLTTPSHFAYLKISEGCDHQCSFCAIPLIRGKHLSRTIEDIVAEAVALKSKGVKELILIAQDLTWYGMDNYGQRMLPKLISALTDADTPEWIRLHYTYPLAFPEELLDIIQANPRVCNYLDIPLQHINDRILKSMRRGGGAKQIKALMQKIRSQYPDIAIRTTMIVGYPGETEEEFQELIDFIKEVRFERLGAFTYSHEEDTPAFELSDNVPPEIKEERLSTLMAVQSEIALQNNASFESRIINVLIDRKEDDFWIGRTEFDSPEVDNEVLIPSDEKLQIGAFYQLTVTSVTEHELYATSK